MFIRSVHPLSCRGTVGLFLLCHRHQLCCCALSVHVSWCARPREPPGWTPLASTWQGRGYIFSFTRRSPATFHSGCACLCQQQGCPTWILCCSVLGQGQGNMQDGQPAGPALASPCGFIFVFIMVNGIGPFSINFSGHLDLFLFPFSFFFNTAQIFPHFFSIEWFCFLVCFQESFMYLGWGSLFGLHVINTVSHAVASLSPHHHPPPYNVS